jgi:hypothetical protein
MLSVGIIIDRPDCPAWFEGAIAAAAGVADFTKIEVPRRAQSETMGSRLLALGLRLDGLRAGADLAGMQQHASGLVAVPAIELDSVGSARFDLIIVACDLEAREMAKWCKHTAFGLWQIFVAGETMLKCRCPGFASLVQDKPTHEVEIVAWTVGASYLVGRAEIRAHGSSLAQNVVDLLQPISGLLRRSLLKIDQNKATGLVTYSPASKGQVPLDVTFHDCLKVFAKAAYRTLFNRLQTSSQFQWGIGVVSEGGPVKWVEAHPYGFLADPFLIQHEGVRYVFFEEFVYQSSKAHISVCILDEDNNPSMPIKILESDHHLSFPFVFRHEGRFYMIPERSAGNSIVLYEAKQFPYDWTFRYILVDNFAGVDSVLHWDKGRLWLFTSDGADGNQDNNLYLFSSPSLFETFRPHRRNPVKEGLRGSRMAGCFIESAGILYRPSQNCSARYGGSLVMNRIHHLSDDDFVEQEVEEMIPLPGSPFPLGLHTCNTLDEVKVIDGLRLIQRPRLADRITTAFSLLLQSNGKKRSRRIVTDGPPIESSGGRP